MLKQDYNAYTEEDHNVWSILFHRQIRHIQGKASQAYLNGLQAINFDANKAPNFDSLNERLNMLTGWQLQCVEGIVPYEEFFGLLAEQRFPCTSWLRTLEQLDYLEEPDMFHDVFGHVPLLTNPDFCEFITQLANLALAGSRDEYVRNLVSRLYWFSVEFGLIEEESGVRIYGAGILSSFGETTYSLESPAPARCPFDFSEMISTSYSKDEYQDKYFVLKSYEQLFECMYVIRGEMSIERVPTDRGGRGNFVRV